MPNTCIHLEKIKEIFGNCNVDKYGSDSPYHAFKIRYEKYLLSCGVFSYNKSVLVDADFANFFREIKGITERCNCENVESLKRRINELESNSNNQLVLRRNAETDLSVVRRERDSLQSSN